MGWLKKIRKETRGRPAAEIDWAEVDEFLQAGCEGTAIAGLLGIHYNTLYERCKRDNKCNFSEYAAEKRREGAEILRYAQFKSAIEGSIPMQMFLGKQPGILGQSDRHNVEHSGHINTLSPDETVDLILELQQKLSSKIGDDETTDPPTT